MKKIQYIAFAFASLLAMLAIATVYFEHVISRPVQWYIAVGGSFLFILTELLIAKVLIKIITNIFNPKNKKP